MKNIVTTLFNQLVPYHESFSDFAAQYYGSIFCIRLTSPNIEIYGIVSHSGIHMCNPDVTRCEIEINIPALLKMAGIHHPKARTVIEGESRFAIGLMKQISLRSINIDHLLSKLFKPRYRVVLTETAKYCAKSLQYCSAEVRMQLIDYLIYDLGVCLDEETNSAHYEKIIRLKWLTEELKHHLSNRS